MIKLVAVVAVIVWLWGRPETQAARDAAAAAAAATDAAGAVADTAAAAADTAQPAATGAACTVTAVNGIPNPFCWPRW